MLWWIENRKSVHGEKRKEKKTTYILANDNYRNVLEWRRVEYNEAIIIDENLFQFKRFSRRSIFRLLAETDWKPGECKLVIVARTLALAMEFITKERCVSNGRPQKQT